MYHHRTAGKYNLNNSWWLPFHVIQTQAAGQIFVALVMCWLSRNRIGVYASRIILLLLLTKIVYHFYGKNRRKHTHTSSSAGKKAAEYKWCSVITIVQCSLIALLCAGSCRVYRPFVTVLSIFLYSNCKLIFRNVASFLSAFQWGRWLAISCSFICFHFYLFFFTTTKTLLKWCCFC